jgi:hypothetical protein
MVSILRASCLCLDLVLAAVEVLPLLARVAAEAWQDIPAHTLLASTFSSLHSVLVWKCPLATCLLPVLVPAAAH